MRAQVSGGLSATAELLVKILSPLKGAWNLVQFTIKAMQYFPPHLKYDSILPWEVRNISFINCYNRYNMYDKNETFNVL